MTTSEPLTRLQRSPEGFKAATSPSKLDIYPSAGSHFPFINADVFSPLTSHSPKLSASKATVWLRLMPAPQVQGEQAVLEEATSVHDGPA